MPRHRQYKITERVLKNLESRGKSTTCYGQYCGQELKAGDIVYSLHSRSSYNSKRYHLKCFQATQYDDRNLIRKMVDWVGDTIARVV